MKRFVSIVVSGALCLIVGVLGILGMLGKYKIPIIPIVPINTQRNTQNTQNTQAPPFSDFPLLSPILHHNDAPLAAIFCNKYPLK